jgi:hypothetical protein
MLRKLAVDLDEEEDRGFSFKSKKLAFQKI